ncbi:MAG: hypothetical protein Q9174_006549 [Haloplaca sp. 1 TL-2023]
MSNAEKRVERTSTALDDGKEAYDRSPIHLENEMAYETINDSPTVLQSLKSKDDQGEFPNVGQNEEPTASKPASLQQSRSYGDGHVVGRISHDRENISRESDSNGFEVQWDDEGNDPGNPRSMSKLRKWSIVLVVSSSSACVTCTSSMYTLTYDQITEEFNCSRIVATLGLSLFVMGLGLGPLVLSPLVRSRRA